MGPIRCDPRRSRHPAGRDRARRCRGRGRASRLAQPGRGTARRTGDRPGRRLRGGPPDRCRDRSGPRPPDEVRWRRARSRPACRCKDRRARSAWSRSRSLVDRVALRLDIRALGPPRSGPSSQSRPSQRRSIRISDLAASRTGRCIQVLDPEDDLPAACRAASQAMRKVRACPRCSPPVGEGARRPTTGRLGPLRCIEKPKARSRTPSRRESDAFGPIADRSYWLRREGNDRRARRPARPACPPGLRPPRARPVLVRRASPRKASACSARHRRSSRFPNPARTAASAAKTSSSMLRFHRTSTIFAWAEPFSSSRTRWTPALPRADAGHDHARVGPPRPGEDLYAGDRDPSVDFPVATV